MHLFTRVEALLGAITRVVALEHQVILAADVMHLDLDASRRVDGERQVAAEVLEAVQSQQARPGRRRRVVELEHFRSNAHAREAVHERLEEGALAGQEVDGVVFR